MSDDLAAYGMYPYLKRKQGDIVGAEIGVLDGRNAAVLFEKCGNINQLYGIDNYVPRKNMDKKISAKTMRDLESESQNILTNAGDRYKLVKLAPEEACKGFTDNTFDFVHLNYNQTYDELKRDLGLYYKLLKSGGYMFVNNYTVSPIIDAVTHFRDENRIRQPILLSKNMVVFWEKR